MPDTNRPIGRFKQFLDFKGVKPHPAEVALGFTNGYIRLSTKGKGGIGQKELESIHSYYPELNILWVLFGEGEMILSGQLAESNTTRDDLNQHVPLGQSGGNAQVFAQKAAQETQNITADCRICEEKQNVVESLREIIKSKDVIIESKEEQIAMLKSILNPSKPATDEDSQTKDRRAV
jgi:hypothetical protein